MSELTSFRGKNIVGHCWGKGNVFPKFRNYFSYSLIFWGLFDNGTRL